MLSCLYACLFFDHIFGRTFSILLFYSCCFFVHSFGTSLHSKQKKRKRKSDHRVNSIRNCIFVFWIWWLWIQHYFFECAFFSRFEAYIFIPCWIPKALEKVKGKPAQQNSGHNTHKKMSLSSSGKKVHIVFKKAWKSSKFHPFVQ